MTQARGSPGLGRIGQIAVNVHDVARATAFYRDVLGLAHLFSFPGMSFFDAGGVRLYLALAARPEFDHPASTTLVGGDRYAWKSDGPEEAQELPLPEISRFFGISIRMYADDHAPPHFHVWHGGVDVPVDIRTLTLTGGRLPPAVLRRVRRWAALHRSELLADWELAQTRQPLRAIEPLR